jgi:hypothetical protein
MDQGCSKNGWESGFNLGLVSSHFPKWFVVVLLEFAFGGNHDQIGLLALLVPWPGALLRPSALSLYLAAIANADAWQVSMI